MFAKFVCSAVGGSFLLLVLTSSADAEGKKKLLLLGQGPDGHPPTTHEYVAGLRVLAKCLAGTPTLEIMSVRADGRWQEGPELIDRADGVVLYLAEGAKWIHSDKPRKDAFDRLARRGGGITALHWAIGTRPTEPIEGFLQLLGGCHGGPDRKFKVLETNLTVADPRHPITAGVRSFRAKDEFYYRLKFVQPLHQIQPILRAGIEGQDETVAWAWERPDNGRSFGFSGLHFHERWKMEEYRRLVAQGVLWTLKLPISREGLPVSIREEDLRVGGE